MNGINRSAFITIIAAVTLLNSCEAGIAAVEPEKLRDDYRSVDARTAENLNAATKLRVKTQVVEQRTLEDASSVTGTVQAFRKSVIASEISGRVSRRLIEPGTNVRTNQILIQLDATQTKTLVKRAQAQVASRETDLQQAQYDLEKGRRLIATKVISQDTLDDFGFAYNRAKSNLQIAEAELAEAQRQLDDTRIRAAFAGIAEVVHVQQGDYLSPGTPVVTLADFTKARVVAGVTAQTARYLKVDQMAQIRLQDQASAAFNAKIQAVGRIADTNGTFPVELWVEGSASEHLREGMVASVSFPGADVTPHPSLPRSAIVRRQGSVFVYVLDGEIATLRPVALGRSDTHYAQVISGVEIGDQVVVDGLFALSDGARVELAN